MAGKRQPRRGADATFKDCVLDRLRGAGAIERRAMFGGYGFYVDGAFFGIVYRGRLYFRTGETTGAEYVKRGMKPFRPRPRQTLGSYYEVPVEILEDAAALGRWARQAAAPASAAR